MAHTRQKTANVGKDVKEPELSFIAGGSVNWYSHFGKLFGIRYSS